VSSRKKPEWFADLNEDRKASRAFVLMQVSILSKESVKVTQYLLMVAKDVILTTLF